MTFFWLSRPLQPFVLILIVASILRILVMILAFQYRENTDVLRYRDWARIAYLHSFADTYKPDYLSFGTLPNNQPPGSLYIITAMYHLQIQTAKVILAATNAAEGSLQFINGPLQNAFLRFPAIVADLLIGALIYKLVRIFSKKQGRALFASCLFLFNPLVLYNSAFWGQMDSLVNLFFLLGILLLVYKRYQLSVFSVFLSLFTKLSLSFLLPLYLFVFYKSHPSKKLFLTRVVIVIIFLFAVMLPISLSPIAWLVQYIQSSAGGEIQSITVFAFNFWWVIFRPAIEIGNPKTLFTFSEINLIGSPFSNEVFLGLSLSTWAVVLFVVFMLPLFYFAERLKEKSDKFFLLFALATLVGFLFLPRMHERYIYPLFPLLSVYVGIKSKFLWTYVLLAILNMVNLYLVWHPMMLSLFPYQLMNNQGFQWIIAAVTLGVGLLFYFRGLKILQS